MVEDPLLNQLALETMAEMVVACIMVLPIPQVWGAAVQADTVDILVQAIRAMAVVGVAVHMAVVGALARPQVG
jgi:hypothetical protein